MMDNKTNIEDVSVDGGKPIKGDGSGSKLRLVVIFLNFLTIFINIFFMLEWSLVMRAGKTDLLDSIDRTVAANDTSITPEEMRQIVTQDFNWSFLAIPPIAVLLIGTLTASFSNYGIVFGQQFWPVAVHSALALGTAVFFGVYNVVLDNIFDNMVYILYFPLVWSFAPQLIPNALLAREIRKN